MFVEHKEALEITEAPARTMTFSEAIRIGKPLVNDESTHSYRLCALGCAWAGVRGRLITTLDADDLVQVAINNRLTIPGAIGKSLGFDPSVAQWVNDMHLRGMAALDIATELEARGF